MAKPDTRADIVVVGGGVVGLALCRELLSRNGDLRVVLLEKEPALAAHQTGRNSGVIHAGIYYRPGSLKERLCKAGHRATIEFCEREGIPFELCGKLIVATDDNELGRLETLYQQGTDNGLPLERLDAVALREREPNVTGRAAVLVKNTGIVSYTAIAEAMAAGIARSGSEVHRSAKVLDIREEADQVVVVTQDRVLRAGQVVVCAGLEADRLARLCGVDVDFRIISFRGEYFRLDARYNDIVRHLIYPVPDPALPFLGIHLTRMIGGYVTVGPNAVLALAREGYRKSDIDLRYMGGLAAYKGFRRLLRTYLRAGITEMVNSLSERRYAALCQRYCPSISVDAFEPHPAGIRAQAVLPDGSLAHDFLIKRTWRTVHVCNAPSPAATSAIPIAGYLVDHAMSELGIRAKDA
ncbi:MULTISPECIES: L-2-hydroxyglutarate oxidase [unclassified Chelatococcus]|uniref:L-2-hydroxyglutarate oxidase n=1 Tax=unclassified Chelatococcus TaxID=2638111 RepID=UPI001BCEEF45|nr:MULTISPECIES: L-2-hydroxyglutarate oxidase [unclassified Chelatococcus]MBS7701621.1 L-2-hydroxyglutarate oxidase [Chelatococcus sp. YT9]MBX3559691.1 L-2-hydroxyglutarate oxidase [Chelatococcus sp.]